jgi:hypothetical protein
MPSSGAGPIVELTEPTVTIRQLPTALAFRRGGIAPHRRSSRRSAAILCRCGRAAHREANVDRRIGMGWRLLTAMGGGRRVVWNVAGVAVTAGGALRGSVGKGLPTTVFVLGWWVVRSGGGFVALGWGRPPGPRRQGVADLRRCAGLVGCPERWRVCRSRLGAPSGARSARGCRPTSLAGRSPRPLPLAWPLLVPHPAFRRARVRLQRDACH